ncbi:protein of unknown function [[Clostridium] ultunense Esp]|uniref:Uncharacterized protein n=10 Tax=Schnuerera ultunensis TaxID=45497 RepID=A0A1M4PSQ3_9FIRM|nr:protein of unknown function [[Clostridium] ultunense Esp]SHD78569.1 protein of unknown function [[Clostridium] ultunense Esp]
MLDERPKKTVSTLSERRQKNKPRPSKNHPWRQSVDKKPTPLYEEVLLRKETDAEIQEILNGLFNSTRAWV